MQKRIKRGAMIFAAVVGMITVSSILGFYAPYPGNTYKHDEDAAHSVFIVSNGVHTSFLFPKKTCFDWTKVIDHQVFKNPYFHFYIFGWGERDFYRSTPTWDEFSPLDGIRALFFSEASAVHVSVMGFKTPPSDAIELKLSEKRCTVLMKYLYDSFLLSEEGKAKSMFSGYGPDDHFFYSSKHYSLFQTCNTWTAIGLREISVPTPLWSATASAVMYHLED